MKRSPLQFDLAREERRIVAFVRKTVGDADAKGVVVGLSGGVDSAVVGALCVKALGKGRVLALLMPSEHTPASDLSDARALVKTWGVESVEVEISPIVKAFLAQMETDGDRVAKANVQARIRMTILYYFANVRRYLVAGTGDRSESLIGYFTKGGDGGVDFMPIAHLFKTQVKMLAGHLGIPKKVIGKPSSPGLWPGHKATDEIPVDYDKLDLVLHCLFDEKMSESKTAEAAGVGPTAVKKVIRMNRDTAHKRSLPPSLPPR